METVIKIDYDGFSPDRLMRRVMKALLILCKKETIKKIRWELNRSIHGKLHLRLHFPCEFSQMEITALQAICGSDYKREACNFLRARSGKYKTIKEFQTIGNRLYTMPKNGISDEELKKRYREHCREVKKGWLEIEKRQD